MQGVILSRLLAPNGELCGIIPLDTKFVMTSPVEDRLLGMHVREMREINEAGLTLGQYMERFPDESAKDWSFYPDGTIGQWFVMQRGEEFETVTLIKLDISGFVGSLPVEKRRELAALPFFTYEDRAEFEKRFLNTPIDIARKMYAERFGEDAAKRNAKRIAKLAQVVAKHDPKGIELLAQGATEIRDKSYQNLLLDPKVTILGKTQTSSVRFEVYYAKVTPEDTQSDKPTAPHMA